MGKRERELEASLEADLHTLALQFLNMSTLVLVKARRDGLSENVIKRARGNAFISVLRKVFLVEVISEHKKVDQDENHQKPS
jgi:hypothetical protein